MKHESMKAREHENMKALKHESICFHALVFSCFNEQSLVQKSKNQDKQKNPSV